jgi:hypothetical protein
MKFKKDVRLQVIMVDVFEALPRHSVVRGKNKAQPGVSGETGFINPSVLVCKH